MLPVRPATKQEQMRECLRSLKQSHKVNTTLLQIFIITVQKHEVQLVNYSVLFCFSSLLCIHAVWFALSFNSTLFILPPFSVNLICYDDLTL
jgi:hypothetical protein